MKFKKIIDISWPISEKMTAYKNRKVVAISHTKTWEQDCAREALVTLGTHTGTHVDAPSHFIEHGMAINQLDVSTLIGSCTVVDMSHVDNHIDANDLENIVIEPDQIILFKTKNSLRSASDLFDASFIYLNQSAARFLAEKKVKAVGIDYLGIERNQPDHETHLLLLEKNIPIIEGLRLEHVQAGTYFLCCLPLAMQGLEAAPARAILMQ